MSKAASPERLAELYRLQGEWLNAKKTLKPRVWGKPLGFSIDLETGKFMPTHGFTPEMRAEFGRFQGGLLAARNGSRVGRPPKYDEDELLIAIRAVRAEHPGWGAPNITNYLRADGHADLRQWKVSALLKTLTGS